MNKMSDKIKKSILESAEIIEKSINLSLLIEESINEIIHCLKNGHKIIIFGNGGSAADAQHIAAEFISRFKIERKSFPAIALTTDTSIITSVGNDYSFEKIFSRQCESLVANGDVVIGISTSGNSKNVENGILTSKNNGAKTIGLLGNDGGRIGNIVDIAIIVNNKSTDKIQEVHRVIYHIICEQVERKMAEKET